MKRLVRALGRVFGWVLVPPVPRPAVDMPSVPLSRREREAFRRIVDG